MTSNYNVLYVGMKIPSKWKEGETIRPDHFSACTDVTKFFKFIDCKITSLFYSYGVGSIMVNEKEWSNKDEWELRFKKCEEYQRSRFKPNIENKEIFFL